VDWIAALLLPLRGTKAKEEYYAVVRDDDLNNPLIVNHPSQPTLPRPLPMKGGDMKVLRLRIWPALWAMQYWPSAQELDVEQEEDHAAEAEARTQQGHDRPSQGSGFNNV
jgi:hypothetical protein